MEGIRETLTGGDSKLSARKLTAFASFSMQFALVISVYFGAEVPYFVQIIEVLGLQGLASLGIKTWQNISQSKHTRKYQAPSDYEP